MAPEETRATRLQVSGTAVTYDASVRVVGIKDRPVRPSPEHDRRLAGALWRDKLLRETLNKRAHELFGKEFSAVVLDIHPGGSVHVIVALYTSTQVAVEVAAFREQAAAFAQRIRDVIAEVGRRGLYDLVIDVEPEAPTLPSQAQAGAQQTDSRSSWDRVSAVLAAVATGIGVLGFVAFVGGAIEFARLSKAGLPAEEAVAVIPTANLIAIGAHVLVPALLLAAIAAILLYVWQLAVAAYYRRRSAKTSTSDDPSRARTFARQALLEPGGRAVALAGIFWALEFVAFFTTYSGRGFEELVAFLLVAGLTGGAVLLVALRSRKFLWVAATAFAAAAVFSSVLAYARTRESLKVRPAAVLSKDNVITGFFIAETPSQIYLGRTRVVSDVGEDVPVYTSRILILPKDEVSDIAIGPLMPPPEAYNRTIDLTGELCGETVREPLAEVKAKPESERTDCEGILLDQR